MCAVSRFPAIQSFLNKILNLPHHITPHSFYGFSTVYRHFNRAQSFALITNQIFSCKVTWQAPLSTSTGFEAKGSRTKAELLPFVHTNVSDWPLTHVSGASKYRGPLSMGALFLQDCLQHFWVTHVLLFFALLPH